MRTMSVRWGLAAAAMLAGCAALTTITSEVATYGDWPAGRACCEGRRSNA